MKSSEAKTSESSSSKAAANQQFGKNCASVVSPHNKFVLQPKLTINQPNDAYEQEADAVADKVMRMTSSDIQTKPLSISGVQRKCADCEEEGGVTQRKELNNASAPANNELENYVGNLNNGGRALPDDIRSFYEPKFGYNFNNVRVHTDSVAAKSAQSINALAYTSGNNIVFNEGQYSPDTDSGKRLLAHELTHVVQQGAFDNSISRFIQRKETPTGGYQPESDEEMVLGGDGDTATADQPAVDSSLGGVASTMSTSNTYGPEWGNNGRFKWWISWATNGTSGWIVQRIENTYSGTLADGTAVTNASVGAVPSYYEAWAVGSSGAISPANRDQWERPTLGALGSQLNFTMRGTVYWTAADPAASGFTPGGVSNAGILLSSTSAPAGLSGPLLTRSAFGAWASDGSQIIPGCFAS